MNLTDLERVNELKLELDDATSAVLHIEQTLHKAAEAKTDVPIRVYAVMASSQNLSRGTHIEMPPISSAEFLRLAKHRVARIKDKLAQLGVES